MKNDFKVGDWVKIKDESILVKHQKSIFKIDFIDKHSNCQGIDSDNEYANIRYLELWTPMEGEWCWLWDDCTPHRPTCRQFGHITSADAAYYVGSVVYCDSEQNPYDNCEPFMNSLPLHLQ